MRIASRIAALELRAAESPPCGCPPGRGVEIFWMEEPPPPVPCASCGQYKTRIVVHEAAPPPLPDVRR